MQIVTVTSVTVVTTKFPFGVYDSTVDSDIGRGDFSFVLGVLHVCGHVHVRFFGHGLMFDLFCDRNEDERSQSEQEDAADMSDVEKSDASKGSDKSEGSDSEVDDKKEGHESESDDNDEQDAGEDDSDKGAESGNESDEESGVEQEKVKRKKPNRVISS